MRYHQELGPDPEAPWIRPHDSSTVSFMRWEQLRCLCAMAWAVLLICCGGKVTDDERGGGLGSKVNGVGGQLEGKGTSKSMDDGTSLSARGPFSKQGDASGSGGRPSGGGGRGKPRGGGSRAATTEGNADAVGGAGGGGSADALGRGGGTGARVPTGAGGAISRDGGAVGDGDAPPEDPLPSLEAGMVFEFHAAPLGEGEFAACQGECGPLTLRIESVGEDRLELFWGSVGAAQRTVAVKLATGWEVDAGIPFATQKGVPPSATSIYFNGARLVPRLGDDGNLELELSGNVISYWKDVGKGSSAPQTVIGTQQERAPTAYVPSAPHWVTTVLRIPIDKPLVSSATAHLRSSDGHLISLTPRTEEGLVVEFSTSQVLPFGTYTLEIAEEDFLGVGTPPEDEVVTIADFGALSDGTFESTASQGVLGGDVIDFRLDEDDPFANVLGAAPQQQVLLRLPAQPSVTKLVFEARLFTPCSPFTFDEQRTTFDVFIVGEDQGLIEGYQFVVPSDHVEGVVGNASVRVSPESSLVEIPLGTAPSGDVLLDFSGYTYGKFGCDSTGILLDNVRLE